MKIIFLFFVIALQKNYIIAQNIYVTLQSGAANYQGDLQKRPFTFAQSGAQVGASISYFFTPKIALSLMGNIGNIRANDAKNTFAGARERNLSFGNQIKEIGLVGIYQIFDLSKQLFSPYGFIGLSFFNHNPYTIDLNGNKVFLEPLSTEGQGLPEYPNRKKYSLNEFSIPFGGGIKINLNTNITIGYELGLRKTFTDYLDDVSTTYPDYSTLINRKGIKAANLSYRGYEIIGASPVFPTQGTPRGGTSKNSDWYYFQGITITVHLAGKDAGILNSQNKYKTKCPSLF